MTFEDAVKSLGAEFGTELGTKEGLAAFTASGDDGEGIDVTLSQVESDDSADISADLGELPSQGVEDMMMKMLEANHLFGGTGGATLSVEGDRVKLERRVPLTDLARGEGAGLLAQFLATARDWRATLRGELKG